MTEATTTLTRAGTHKVHCFNSVTREYPQLIDT